jgi:hypothetical protein
MTREFVPEFFGPGLLSGSIDGVQGGTFPSRIWGAFMTPAMYGRPVEDWPAPGPPARPAARLYLPGVECPLSRPAPTAPPSATPPTATTVAEQPAEETEPVQPAGLRAPHGVAGMRLLAAPPTEPPPAEPAAPGTDPAAPVETEPGTDPVGPAPGPTRPPAPVVVQPDPTDTTIPPSILDPRAPLPMVSTGVGIARCTTAPRAP